MQLFSQFVEWQNYAATQFAEAEVNEAKAEASAKFVEAQKMVGNWSTNDKVTVARAEMALDPEVDKARTDVIKAYAVRKMQAVMYENCERCANLISRELSRRIGAGPTQRRQGRWQP
jgi:hypothetical protein